MAERLPDRMTVKLQVLQRFQELGETPSPQQVIQATDETMAEIRRQHLQSLPSGVARYEMEGKKDSAGFLKRMIHTADTMGHNLVAGSVGNALALSSSEWAVKASEDLRKWANESVAESVARDPELQAYYSWKEDEPSWTGFDTTMRAMSEVIPSLATSVAGTAMGIALAPSTGGTSLTATVASLAPMFLLESSSNYIEQMNLMVDDMGMEPEEAREYAGLAATTYGILASMLERTGARSLMKGVPGFKEMIPEKAMMRKITESLVESGANKGTIARMGMNNVARLTNMVEKAMIEGGTEWSQATLEQTSLYATEHGFENNREFLKTLTEIAKTEGVLEEAYGGGVMGVPFGIFLPGRGKAVSQRQSERILESVKNKSAANAFEPFDPNNPDARPPSADVVDNYLSALANPRERMGEFWDDFKEGDDKTSKSIAKNKQAQSSSNAILSLIVDDPTVISAIENHPDRDSILRLATEKLNQQNPNQRQINTEDTQEMINAIKAFAQKGSIVEKEAPVDLTQSPEAPDINFSPAWLEEPVDESLFVPKEEPSGKDVDAQIKEEPDDIEAAQEAMIKKFTDAEVVEEKPKVDAPDKALKGKTITLPDKLEGKNIQGFEGKQVAVLGAGPKMYKIREVGEDGKLTGPIKYVTPSQIQEQTTPDVKTKAPKEVKPQVITKSIRKKFVETGEVPQGVLVNIANKIEEGKPLTKNEEMVRQDKNQEVEALLREKVTPKPEPKVTTDEVTEADIFGEPDKAPDSPTESIAELAKNKFEGGIDSKEFKDFAKKLIGTDSISKMLPNEREMLKKALKGEVETLEEAPTPTFRKILRSPDANIELQTQPDLEEGGKDNWKSLYASLFQEGSLEIGQLNIGYAKYIPAFKKLIPKRDKFIQLAIKVVEYNLVDVDTAGFKTGLSKAQQKLVDQYIKLNDEISNAVADIFNPYLAEEGYSKLDFQDITLEPDVTAADIEGKPELPEGTPDVATAPESIEELESEVNENQFRAEQRTKDYLIDGVSYQRVSNVIGTTYSGEPDKSAIKAGNTVDGLVRAFFTDGEVPVHTDIDMSKDAFDDLMRALGEVKKKIDAKGLRVLANNIIVWDDGSGVAGEVDLFVLNPETGNIQIWDVKTSKASTKTGAYTKVWKGNGIERSKKQQHEAQLSAYKRLVENQYGVRVEKIAIFPFQVKYNKRGKITSLTSESGVSLDFDKAFVDSIIEPNKLSENIPQELPPKEEVKEKKDEAPIGLQEEPDDETIGNFLDTVLGNMASNTEEETGDTNTGDIEQDDDENINMFQEVKVSPLPKITSNAELAEKIVSRLRRHFGNYITDATFEGVLEENGKRAVGVAISNVALWSSTDATLDTMPHEYAHIYVGLLKDTDLIKRAINQFGSEEKLVQYIGEYYANRIQNRSILNRIKIWLKQFANRLRNIFRGVPDDALGDFVAEEFYQGRWAGKIGLEYDPYAKFQEQGATDEDGNDTGVNSSRHSTSDIPSDLHQSEFFHKVFGVHISKAQVPILSEMAQQNDTFEEYIEAIKDWAKEQAKEKSYRVNIKTEYNQDDLNDLKIAYLKDRNKIPRYVPKQQVGLFTRVYRSLILPTGKKTKTQRRVKVSPVERLDTKTKESQYETTNFFEEDLRLGKHNKKIIHFRTKDIMNEWLNDEGEYIYWQASTKLTEEVLDSLEASEYKSYIRQVIKHGKDDANLLFIIGMKGGNDNSILMGNADNQYADFTEADFENYLNAEVAAGRLREDHVEVMLEDWVTKDKSAKKWVVDFIKTYTPELLEGETLKDAKIRVAREIVPYVKNMRIQQAIGIHEYMKAIKYDTYAMDEKHILDTYNRLRLDLTNGYNPHTGDGSLNSKVMIVPRGTIVRKTMDDGTVLQSGFLGDGDGHTQSGSRWFNRLGENIGTPKLSAIKTVIRHKTFNENKEDDYIAMKHLQMVPFKGEEYYRPGENFPFARVIEGADGTYFEALDENGNVTGEFDHLNTNNESKQRAGKFRDDYVIHDLLESDVKIIMNPVGSSNTAAHPIALGEILLDPSVIENPDTPEAMNLAKAIMKHYGDVAKDYLSMLKSMRKNPKTFLNAVKRTREEGRIPTDAEKWMDLLEETGGDGVAHKYITNLFVSYLKNRYFTDGIYKGRQLAKGNATHAYLKPARHLNNLIDYGNVAVSYDNSTVRFKAIEHWASLNRDSIVNAIPYAKDWDANGLWKHFSKNMDEKEKLDALNEALMQGDGVNVILHRQPIAKVTGVVTRRVQFLVEGGHGDTMFLRNSDVVEVLDGDWDGDHGFAEFISGEFLQAYQDWQGSKTFEDRDTVVALPMFGEKLEDVEDSNTSYVSKDSRDASILGEAAVSGAQGRATNAKVVMTQLAYKEAKIYLSSMEGGFISAKNPSDSVVMDYIELDENQLNKNNGDLIDLIYKNGDTIVDADGNEVNIISDIPTRDAPIEEREVAGSLSIDNKGEPMYLKTTVEGELAILLQMAVDNKKFGLLSKIGWNNDFILRRIFKRSDGEDLTKGNIKTMRVVFNVQNFSGQRAGLTTARNVASMSRIIEDSRDLTSRFFTDENKKAPKEELGIQMIKEFQKVVERMRFKPKNLERPALIQTNGKITPGESLIASVGIAYNDMVGNIQDVEKAGSHFLDWSEEAYQAAHSITVDELGNDPSFDADKWSSNDLSLAYEFLVSNRIDVLNEKGEVAKKTSFNEAFWNIYHEAQRESTDDVPLHISADYNEFLNKFVEDHVEDWLSLPDSVQDLVTSLFLKGIGKRTNILTLMPIDLMSHRVLTKFLPLFEKNLKALKESDFSAQTGNKKAMAGYKKLSQLSIQGSKAYKKAGQQIQPRCK